MRFLIEMFVLFTLTALCYIALIVLTTFIAREVWYW